MHATQLTAYGEMKYFLKDQFIGRSIRNYGEWCFAETEKILSLANGLCLDIGANIGYITKALESSGFDVIAFEPQEEVFKVLSENVSSKCMNVAVGDYCGKIAIPRISYATKGNFGGVSVGSGSNSVDIISIDSLELDVGFMKIDVEGFEYCVLRGAVETIKRCRPIIYLEDDRIEHSRKLYEFLSELGYRITEHKPFLFRKNNFLGCTENIWGANYGSHNLICLPIENQTT